MSGVREHDGATGTEAWFRSLLTNISDTVSICDAETRILFTTGAANQVLGYPSDFWTGALPAQLVHPEDLDTILGAWREVLRHPGEEISTEVRMEDADGTWQDISVTGVNLLDDPTVGGVVITTRNITPLRRAERLASSQAGVLELIARGAPMATVAEACIDLLEENGVHGAASIYLLEGERLEVRAGRAPAAVKAWVREPIRDPDRSLCDAAIAIGGPVVVDDVAEATLSAALRDLLDAEGIRSGWSLPISSTSSDEAIGSLSIVARAPHRPSEEERRVAEVACSLVAIALERERNEARLAHQALHDALTGLPNRALLLDRMDRALARRRHVGSDFALLFCDIDRFKVINDSLGHNVGDQLLVAFAERIRSVIAPSDTIARFGGDEFVVLIEDLTTEEQPIQVAAELAATLERPFFLPAGKEVYLTVSIGLARATDQPSGDDWLRDADAAMYRAKDEGRNRLAQFDSQMRDAAVARLQVEHDLRRAVDRGELVVHYQPVVELRSGRIVGAEALVRWEHPERGLLAPHEFIGVAEDIGTIGDLGRHVLEVSVAAVSELDDARRRPFQLGVNLSARQLSSGGLDQQVAGILDRFGWPASSLLLEITETALIQGVDGPIEEMTRLRELGVSLAIDDFGTGYSSLERLGRLPVDQIKVDRSFVAAIDRPGDRSERIVDAVIAIAEALDHRTTAEGVETQRQLDYLRRARCDYAQGYLFSKPVSFEELAAMLHDDPRW